MRTSVKIQTYSPQWGDDEGMFEADIADPVGTLHIGVYDRSPQS